MPLGYSSHSTDTSLILFSSSRFISGLTRISDPGAPRHPGFLCRCGEGDLHLEQEQRTGTTQITTSRRQPSKTPRNTGNILPVPLLVLSRDCTPRGRGRMEVGNIHMYR